MFKRKNCNCNFKEIKLYSYIEMIKTIINQGSYKEVKILIIVVLCVRITTPKLRKKSVKLST